MIQELKNQIIQILDEVEVKNLTLQSAVESLTVANENLQENIKGIEQEKVLAENKVVELESTVYELNNRIEELENTDLSQQILSLNAEINALKIEKESLKELASINLEEVQTIIEELKGLIVNA
jgi:predicted nuclease with TOPRIM domain